jgi:hypothetical protein
MVYKSEAFTNSNILFYFFRVKFHMCEWKKITEEEDLDHVVEACHHHVVHEHHHGTLHLHDNHAHLLNPRTAEIGRPLQITLNQSPHIDKSQLYIF